MTSMIKAAKWILPFVVSGGILFALLSRMDLATVLDRITPPPKRNII